MEEIFADFWAQRNVVITWVVVKIMVPFWIRIILRHLFFRVPKGTIILATTHLHPWTIGKRYRIGNVLQHHAEGAHFKLFWTRGEEGGKQGSGGNKSLVEAYRVGHKPPAPEVHSS